MNSMYKTWMILLMTLSIQSLAAQEYSAINGQIEGISGKSKISLKLDVNQEELKTYTDENGFFVFNVELDVPSRGTFTLQTDAPKLLTFRFFYEPGGMDYRVSIPDEPYAFRESHNFEAPATTVKYTNSENYEMLKLYFAALDEFWENYKQAYPRLAKQKKLSISFLEEVKTMLSTASGKYAGAVILADLVYFKPLQEYYDEFKKMFDALGMERSSNYYATRAKKKINALGMAE